MIRFPDQFELIKSNPDLISGLVDESIRWSTPTKHFVRSAARDTEIHGVPIQAMDRVCMLLFSGNRDEHVYQRPDDFDITRSPNRHLSFSHGPHVCLGQHIAKFDIQVLFSELLPRLKSIELAGEPERDQSNLVSNWRTLPIRFTKV
jgi:cytochrome P450